MDNIKTERKNITQTKTTRKPLTFPKIGEVIENRFEIQEVLGEGAHTISYKVYDFSVKLEKTLKVFGLYVEVFHYLPEIRKEAKLYQTVNHESLPVFYEYYETDYVFFEMEYIKGHDLRTLLNRGIDKKDRLSYALQLAQVIYKLHFFEVEHKDLKPENILIDNTNKLYLIDLGTAALNNIDNNIIFEGTSEYCPPEAKLNEEKQYARDIFAYGVILYEIFYNKYPFEKDPQGSISYRIPNHIISSSIRINRIIKKCLNYFQEDRYQNIKRIEEDLNEILSKEHEKKHEVVQTHQGQQFNTLTHNFKKDLRYLWISFISLLLLIPFNLFIETKKEQIENEIPIEGDLYSIYLNSLLVGDLRRQPLIVQLKKGDVISFVNQDNISDFEMIYGKEKALNISKRGNNIFINNQLKGLHIYDDIDIKKSINFISIRGDIDPNKLRNLHNRNIKVGFTMGAHHNLLSFIPRNTKTLSLREYKRDLHLRFLTSFNDLISLDLTGVDNVNFETLPHIPSLKSLNLQKTNVSNIVPLTKLKRLRYLNLEDNFVDDVTSLTINKAIERLSLSNNQYIKDFMPLTSLTKLMDFRNNNYIPPDQIRLLTQHQAINKQEKSRTQKIIITHKDQLITIFNIILFILLGVIGLQLLLLLIKIVKVNKKEKKPIEKTQDDILNLVTKKHPDVHILRQLNSAIQAKRLYYPSSNNALSWLFDLIKDCPGDEITKVKKNEVMKEVEMKIKTHLLKKEYEPIYMATSAINEYFPNRSNLLLLKKAKKKLERSPFIKFITMKSGTYFMGDFQGKTNLSHKVELSSYKITEAPITNQQYCRFLNEVGNKIENGQTFVKTNSEYSRIVLKNGIYYTIEPYASFPVYEVSWFGAQAFCEWLGGRLPTEAEWEYAARSKGLNIPFATGHDITRKTANFLDNGNISTWNSLYPIKTYPPNKLGLYEMSGNILEWCYDWFDSNYYFESPSLDPIGPAQRELKAARGGAWCFGKEQTYTYFRSAAKPSARNNYTGFRVVLPIK